MAAAADRPPPWLTGCGGRPRRRSRLRTRARVAGVSRPERRIDGHQHRAGHDERGDRLAVQGPHPVLVVGPERARPDRHRPRRGRLPLHPRGTPDPRLQRPADVGEHRPRRPPRHRRDARAGAEAPVRAARVRHRDPRPARGEAGRDPAGRHEQGVLHAGRRRGDRERDQARPPLHRPVQGPRPLPRLPRGDLRGDDADRRPAPLGERARPGRRRPLPRHPPLGRGRAAPGRGVAPGPRGRDPVRGPELDRRGLPRDDRRHQRHPHPARRLHPGRARDLRPQRDPDGLRRGHGGLRPHRPLVRGRPLGRRARPDDDGQGPDVELPAAGRRRDARHHRRGDGEQDVLRRPHLQQPPGQPRRGAGDDRRLRGGRPHRQRGAPRRRDARAPRGPGGQAPVGGRAPQPRAVRDPGARPLARAVDADDARSTAPATR